MIRFSLFGIPVQINPLHWVGLALIGGAFDLASVANLLPLLLFILAGFLAILSHELGHALVGKTLAGGYPAISLELFGGMTYHVGARFTKAQTILRILAGPLTNLLLGGLLFFFVSNNPELILKLQTNSVYFFIFLNTFMWISLFWGAFNLVPIYPLDGGQILKTSLKSHDLAHKISFGIACLLCLLCILFYNENIFNIALTGYLAYLNYKMIKNPLKRVF